MKPTLASLDPIELMTAPLFSVIIPLEYHRGQWERCWLGWQARSRHTPDVPRFHADPYA
jgi:hypothetical protein